MKCERAFRCLPWGQVFPYMCHEIWNGRNNCVFTKSNPSPVQVTSFKASGCAREYGVAMENRAVNTNLSRPMFTHPPDYLMIHVDASFVSPFDILGLGEVVRDGKVTWLLGFSKKIYANSPLQPSCWLFWNYCMLWKQKISGE